MKSKRLTYVYPQTQEEDQLVPYINERIRELGIVGAAEMLGAKVSGEKLTKQETKQQLNIALDATHISTKEQLIEACNIDTSVWEISSFQTSAWPQKAKGQEPYQLFAVKARFERIKNTSIAKWVEKLEKGLYQAPNIIKRKAKLKATKEFCGLINIFDAHIDKVTLLGQTETESDISTNVAHFENNFDFLLDDMGKAEFLVFPVGNDFFNVNDARNTTKKGTPQPSTLTHLDAFEIGLDLIIRCIDKARQTMPVEVPIVQGNHDEDLATLLGIALAKIYRNCLDVVIDARQVQRKYKRYFNNLFMFDHGDKVKVDRVPVIMAHERRKDWAETQFRYNFRGHCHHSQEFKITTIKETVGCEIHHLRALSQPSKWNVDAGWVGAQKSTTSYKISRCGAMFNKFVLTL